ncbi:MAG: putative sporulation protein YtxC [Eubacteriales bacterium]|nr:putative sporulation protein YtxC [Eubacteriales bacterium]
MDILIGIEDSGVALKPLIANRIHDALRQGCIISTSDIDGTDGRMVGVAVRDCEHSHKKEYAALCAILADIIVENLQIRHLVRLLKEEYYFLSEKEQCDILVHVLKRIWYGTSGQKNEVAVCKSDVRQRLLKTILENEANSIILEGFMRFRMKDYLDLWERELCICVEDYLRKKEYTEFVEILRLFVKIRIPRVRKVHIYVDRDGEYMLFDERLSMLKCKFMGPNIDRDDALLSALVNIAPASIVVHNKEKVFDARILETIQDVFGQRVEFSEDIL